MVTSSNEFSLREDFIYLSSDRTLKIKFKEEGLEKNWISMQEEYPVISKKALNVLLLFPHLIYANLDFQY